MHENHTAYMMDRGNIDWAACLDLGHDKISMSALHAGSGRAKRPAMRTRQTKEARDAKCKHACRRVS